MPRTTTFRCPDFTEYKTLVEGGPFQRRMPTPDEIETGRSLLSLEPRNGELHECSLEKTEIFGLSWGVFTSSDGEKMAVRWIAPLEGFIDHALEVSVNGVMITVSKS